MEPFSGTGGKLRKPLDFLYDTSGAIAALFLCGICLVVLAQVGMNVMDKVAELLTGEAIGLVIPSYAEFAGYFLAASSFLALAYTLRGGAHIRVNLFISDLSAPRRRFIELVCTGAGALFSAYATYSMVRLTVESFTFGDVSPGIVPVPLWIPQSALSLGLGIGAICFFDSLAQVLRGQTPAYLVKESQIGTTGSNTDKQN